MAFNNIPVATIDPTFLGQINNLKEDARRVYVASLAGSDTNGNLSSSNLDQRRWQVPLGIDITDPAGIGTAFDRSKINLIYIRALTKGPPLGLGDNAPEGEGRVSDCQVEKIQLDYLAAQERAFRLRHASSVRCVMHAANRRRGQSIWNDTGKPLVNLGAGAPLSPSDVVQPVGGVFTTMIRYLLLLMAGGYNELNGVNINGPDTIVKGLPDSTVVADTTAII